MSVLSISYHALANNSITNIYTDIDPSNACMLSKHSDLRFPTIPSTMNWSIRSHCVTQPKRDLMENAAIDPSPSSCIWAHSPLKTDSFYDFNEFYISHFYVGSCFCLESQVQWFGVQYFTILHTQRKRKRKHKAYGECGHRFHYLPHAKRALYHLSWFPCKGEHRMLLVQKNTCQSQGVQVVKESSFSHCKSTCFSGCQVIYNLPC